MIVSLVKENINTKNILTEIKKLNETIFFINKYIYEEIISLSDEELKKIFSFNENLKNFIENINTLNLIVNQKKLYNKEINIIKKYFDIFNQFIEINKNMLNNKTDNKKIKEYQEYLKQELEKNKDFFQLVLDNSKNLYKYNEFHEVLSKLKNNIINMNVKNYNHDKNEKTKNNNRKKNIFNSLKSIFSDDEFWEVLITVGIFSFTIFLIATLFKNITKVLNSVPTNAAGNPEIISDNLFNAIMDKNVIFGFFMLLIFSLLYKTYRENKI